jgi:hypothetical protein
LLSGVRRKPWTVAVARAHLRLFAVLCVFCV